ncbi:chorismate mutase [Candidatus Bathyarchaeota archaeon]|nr:chorismate mutase [Candidatus Bathyarchaeota archaeon]
MRKLEEIEQLRKKIDEIDEEILSLLKERIEISKQIGEVKRNKGLPIKDLERELEKYQQVAKKAIELGLNAENVKNIYKNIIKMSRQIQEQAITRKK